MNEMILSQYTSKKSKPVEGFNASPNIGRIRPFSISLRAYFHAISLKIAKLFAYIAKKSAEGAETHNRAHSNPDDRYYRNYYNIRGYFH